LAVADLADDQHTAAGTANTGTPAVKKKHRVRNTILVIWLILMVGWLISYPLPWQFSVQFPKARTHLYLIDGTLYWQHELIHSDANGSFIKLGTLVDGRLLAPATRLLITTNGVGAPGAGIVGLHGLVWSWNPLAGSGLWLSPLVLGVILIGPMAWWAARRWGRRTPPAPKIRTA
jgi:hypothetical protein